MKTRIRTLNARPNARRTSQRLVQASLGGHVCTRYNCNVTRSRVTKPFISYAREDVAQAQRLYRDLKKMGASPWLDREELLGGQEWEPAIRDAVRQCTHFLALISVNSVNKRGFVQKELRQALDLLDEFPPGQMFIIPVRLDRSTPSHEKLRRLHWIDLMPDYQNGLERVAASLGITATSGATRPPAAEAVSMSSDVVVDPMGVSELGAVPPHVGQSIRARARQDYPYDTATRAYVSSNEVNAWRHLQSFEAYGVPLDIIAVILRDVARRHPDQFSTQLYVANSQINAWRALQTLEAPDITRDEFRKIVLWAEQRYPHDFATRLYVINEELAAWRSLRDDPDPIAG